VFEAKLLLNDELSEKLHWQKETYNIIKIYGRTQLKQEIETVHRSLFSEVRHKSFSEKIKHLFSKQ
jgi:hypothetical protein